MTIKTKFDIDDTVWYIDFMSRPVSGTVKRITLTEFDGMIVYSLYVPGIISPQPREKDLYLTKEEALLAEQRQQRGFAAGEED